MKSLQKGNGMFIPPMLVSRLFCLLFCFVIWRPPSLQAAEYPPLPFSRKTSLVKGGNKFSKSQNFSKKTESFSPFFMKNVPRKKVLFITPELNLGGTEKAFIGLANTMPRDKIDMEVCILKHGGLLEDFLDKDLPQCSLETAYKKCYDAVISCAQWIHPDLWVKKIRAKRRIQWIHTDMYEFHYEFPLSLKKNCVGIDDFVCISQKAGDGFKKVHPNLSSKTHVIFNVVDTKLIKKEAELSVQDIKRGDGILNVLTVSRLSEEKGIARCLRVHKRLRDEGFNFRWYIVGEGNQRGYIEGLIQKEGLQNQFILLGLKMNPYPYMKACDIFVLASSVEGCPLVITEAQILGLPILATDVGGIPQQIHSGVNGLVVKNDEQEIYLGLKRLLTHQALREKFSCSLKDFQYDNRPTYKAFERLIFRESSL
jgi:glycosyltransferase involved in cell wall biosynthesis